MHLEVRQAKDVVILDLKGKLTAGLGDQLLREAIDELLAESKSQILINLSDVAFLDSAGVGELVAGLRTAKSFRCRAQAPEGQRTRLLDTRHGAASAHVRDLRGRDRSGPFVRRRLSSAPASLVSGGTATVTGSRLVTRSSIEHSGQLIDSP